MIWIDRKRSGSAVRFHSSSSACFPASDLGPSSTVHRHVTLVSECKHTPSPVHNSYYRRPRRERRVQDKQATSTSKPKRTPWLFLVHCTVIQTSTYISWHACGAARGLHWQPHSEGRFVIWGVIVYIGGYIIAAAHYTCQLGKTEGNKLQRWWYGNHQLPVAAHSFQAIMLMECSETMSAVRPSPCCNKKKSTPNHNHGGMPCMAWPI